MFEEKDKVYILTWMRTHCSGYAHAMTKENILRFIMMHERKLRAILSSLKHDGVICSTSSLGYWYFDIETATHDEIEKAKHSWLEMKSRAMNMLKDCDKQLDKLNSQPVQMELL